MGSKRKRIHLAGYVMIAPAYLVYVFFILIPILFTIITSFTNYNLFNTYDFVGPRNYSIMINDKVFLQSVKNTIQYALSIFPTIILALFLANLLTRKSKLTSVFRTFNYLPHVASMVSVSMIWLFILDPVSGVLNMILRALGLQPGMWLTDPKKALLCLIVIGIWKTVGYFMVIYQAGITSIPAELYEASTLDGVNPWQKLWHITWPMLQPTTFFLFVTGIINCFSVFEQVNIMTGGGPINSTTTIVHQIYRRAFLDFRMGYGSAMAVSLLLVTFVMTMILFRFGSRTTDTGN